MKNARIERIMNVRARSLDGARKNLTAGEKFLGQTRDALSAVQAAWVKTASLPSPQTINDLVIDREPLLDLEAMMRRSVEACALAEQKVGELREEVLAAQFELRKIERWDERAGERQFQEEMRVERRIADESVARARAVRE